MKYFVTHYTPLVERKKHIIKQLINAGIEKCEFIETKDRDVLTENELKKFKQIMISEVSLFLKHVEVFKQDSGEEIIVVFEDDAILCPNFNEQLDACLSQLETEEWDVLFSGECCNMHCNVDPGKLVVRTDSSRGCCMYVLNKGVGKQLYDLFLRQKEITIPVDWWFYRTQPTTGLKYFWSEPTLVDQGSTSGLFKSSLRGQSNL